MDGPIEDRIMSKYSYTSQRQIRDAFWNVYFVEGKPRKYYGKRQNNLPADVRMAFVDFVEHLRIDEAISETLAYKVTL